MGIEMQRERQKRDAWRERWRGKGGSRDEERKAGRGRDGEIGSD